MAENNETFVVDAAALCDESKCVSTGLSAAAFNNSFTCYGDETGEFYPMMCADGYLPQIVDSESPVFDRFPLLLDSIIVRKEGGCDEEKTKSGNGDNCNRNESVELRYFTCCPPDRKLSENLQRHCSDPITIPVTQTIETSTEKIAVESALRMPCTKGTIRRDMKTYVDTSTANDPYKSRIETTSFMCCDTIIDEDEQTRATTDFLSDYTECVPYHDEFYTEGKAINYYGRIHEMSCGDISKNNNRDSWFPRPKSIEWNHTYDCDCKPLAYQCCRTGPAMPPFVKDAALYKTIYPQLVLSSAAAVVCIILALSLLMPLVTPPEDNTGSRRFSFGSSITSRFSSSMSRPSSSRFSFTSIQRASEQRASIRMSSSTGRPNRSASRYSTYNLYLVYLAIPDLLYNLYIISIYSSYANNNPERYRSANASGIIYPKGYVFGMLVVTYAIINLYLNALVSWEVYALLRSSHQRQRVKPPSLSRVTWQALGVYGIAVLNFCTHYGLVKASFQAGERGQFKLSTLLAFISVFITVGIGYLLPLLVVIYIYFQIWRNSYLPPIRTGSRRTLSRRNKALRELTWFFLRIIAVFFVFWVPSLVGGMFCMGSVQGTGCTSANLLMAAQPIFTMCIALTKSDVMNYVKNFVTLSCLRSNPPDDFANEPTGSGRLAANTALAVEAAGPEAAADVKDKAPVDPVEDPADSPNHNPTNDKGNNESPGRSEVGSAMEEGASEKVAPDSPDSNFTPANNNNNNNNNNEGNNESPGRSEATSAVKEATPPASPDTNGTPTCNGKPNNG
uniref:G-protein coupled receptors family 1 profile domain-containing protein n=1 Tax=Pseudo-nitzschia australis TaxID=44445 RepID=A0A7S4ENL7_9STRA